MKKWEREREIQDRVCMTLITISELVILGFAINSCNEALASEVTAPVAGFIADMNEIDLSVEDTEELPVIEQMYCEEELFTFDEQYLLATLIYAESGACKYDTTLQYVGSVALNRVGCEFYPNDLYSVIYDKHWGIQYACAYDGGMNKTPDQRCLDIASDLLTKWYTDGTTYLPSNVLGQAGFVTLHGEYTRSEGIIFSFY